MSNYAPLYEDVGGNGGVAPLILNVGARWRWMVSFTHRPLYSGERASHILCVRSRAGPRANLDVTENRHISCPCQESNRDFLLFISSPSHCTGWAVVGGLKNLHIWGTTWFFLLIIYCIIRKIKWRRLRWADMRYARERRKTYTNFVMKTLGVDGRILLKCIFVTCNGCVCVCVCVFVWEPASYGSEQGLLWAQ